MAKKEQISSSEHHKRVKEKIELLIPVFAKASIGDFSEEITIPEEEDEFSPLFAGVQLMLEVVREQFQLLKVLNQSLEQKVDERTREVSNEREKFYTLLHAGPDAVIAIDENALIAEWNKQAEKMFGWKKNECEGKGITRFIVAEKYTDTVNFHLSEIIKNASGDSPSLKLEILACNKSGFQFPVELTLSNVSLGQHKYFIGFFRDISDRKKAQQEEKIKTEKLYRINQELEKFAYVASHDLQEPLRTITTYVQLIELKYRNSLEKDAVDYLNFVVEGTSRMHQLIKDLLAYSKIGFEHKNFTEFEISDIWKVVVKNLSTLIDENSAKIKIYGNKENAKLFADKSQIIELFQNLISNAIKFRGNNNPVIEIDYQKKGKIWVFSVRDNGIGIQKEFVDKIFVIFQRLHNRNIPGTGIGLAVCKKIVENHGGKIWVESVPGNGSDFQFTIESERQE